MSHRHLQSEGLAKPRGNSQVVAARGTQVFIAGQVAFDAGRRVVGLIEEVEAIAAIDA